MQGFTRPPCLPGSAHLLALSWTLRAGALCTPGTPAWQACQAAASAFLRCLAVQDPAKRRRFLEEKLTCAHRAANVSREHMVTNPKSRPTVQPWPLLDPGKRYVVTCGPPALQDEREMAFQDLPASLETHRAQDPHPRGHGAVADGRQGLFPPVPAPWTMRADTHLAAGPARGGPVCPRWACGTSSAPLLTSPFLF